jgi:uncharacterized protein (DUF952 family)
LRWLYHALVAADDVGDPYAAASLATEGFVHCSYASLVHESIALYLPKDDPLVIFQIDPRGLTVDLAETPRGPMPHVLTAIPRSAIRERWSRSTLPSTLPDEIP